MNRSTKHAKTERSPALSLNFPARFDSFVHEMISSGVGLISATTCSLKTALRKPFQYTDVLY